MNRRSFLRGAAVLAPAVILTPGLLMPVRPSPFAAGVLGRYEGFTFLQPMTATEILARQQEAMLRMAEMIANPPLIEYINLDRITYEVMNLSGIPKHMLHRPSHATS